MTTPAQDADELAEVEGELAVEMNASAWGDDEELYADEEADAELLANWGSHSAEDQKRARESLGMTSDDVAKMTARLGHGR